MDAWEWAVVGVGSGLGSMGRVSSVHCVAMSSNVLVGRHGELVGKVGSAVRRVSCIVLVSQCRMLLRGRIDWLGWIGVR